MKHAQWLLILWGMAALAGCKKEATPNTCFIPFVDFVAYNVNPSTLEVSFNAITAYNGTITKHHWDFGDGTTFDGPVPPTHVYPRQSTTSGSKMYRVTYTVANDCGEAYWSQDVNLSPCLPTVKFSYTLVNDSTVRFTNQTTSGSGVQYEWTFGDGSKSNASGTTLTKTYQLDGTYNVTLKATNACGDNFFTTPVSICAKASAAQQVELLGCGKVNLNAGGSRSAYLYQWDLGNGVVLPAQPSTTPTLSYTYPAAGQYNIRLKVINRSGCDSAFATTPVSITANPLIANNTWSFTSDDLQVSFRRNAVGGATGYAWDFGDGTTAAVQNPDKLYANPGSYTLTATAFNACNRDSFRSTITIPFYKNLGSPPNTPLRDVTVLSANAIFVLGANGKMYRSDTAGNWTGPISLPGRLQFDNNTHLFRDVNNELWVYGKGEVAKWNAGAQSWVSYLSSGWGNNPGIEDLAIDNQGNVWVIAGSDVWRNSTKLNSTGNPNFSALAFAPQTARVWAVAVNRSEVYFATPFTSNMSSTSPGGYGGGAADLQVGPNGNLYIANPQGIVVLTGAGAFSTVLNSGNTAGLLTGQPQDFGFDNENNLWVVQGSRLLKVPLAASASAKNYSNGTGLNALVSLEVWNVGGTDNDLLLTKTSGHAAVLVK